MFVKENPERKKKTVFVTSRGFINQRYIKNPLKQLKWTILPYINITSIYLCYETAQICLSSPAHHHHKSGSLRNFETYARPQRNKSVFPFAMFSHLFTRLEKKYCHFCLHNLSSMGWTVLSSPILIMPICRIFQRGRSSLWVMVIILIQQSWQKTSIKFRLIWGITMTSLMYDHVTLGKRYIFCPESAIVTIFGP